MLCNVTEKVSQTTSLLFEVQHATYIHRSVSGEQESQPLVFLFGDELGLKSCLFLILFWSEAKSFILEPNELELKKKIYSWSLKKNLQKIMLVWGSCGTLRLLLRFKVIRKGNSFSFAINKQV